MIDRLSDLRKLAQYKGFKTEEPVEDAYDDNKDIKQFSVVVTQAHIYIKEINLNIERLNAIREQVTTAIGEKEKNLNNEIDNLLTSTNMNQQKTKLLLDNLQEKIKTAKDNEEHGESPELRIMQNLYGSLIKQFEDVATRFQAIQSEIKNMMQTKVVRDAEIILRRRLDPEEQQDILNNPEQVQKFYEDRLTGAAHINLVNAVSDLEDRHKDIMRLEKSVNQVHQLFIDLAALVQLQGEMIDNIEMNINKAKDFVIAGEKDIIKAKENMQAARKKKCCILLIVMAVLIVILAPVLGTTLGKA